MRLEPILITEEEYRFLEECVMSDPSSRDEPGKYLLERVLDSREGSYLHPITEAEADEVKRLLLLRQEI